MRKAQITDGVVSNIVAVDPDNVPEWAQAWPEASDDAEIGGTHAGGTFVRRPAPAPDLGALRAKAKLTKAQFIVRCKRAGILSAEDALSAAKGDMPPTFLAAITAAGGDADEAQIVWASVAEVWRLDPYIQILAALPAIGDAVADTLFGIS